MRNRILDRLAYLADLVIFSEKDDQKEDVAETAMYVAVSYHPHIPPSEGSP